MKKRYHELEGNEERIIYKSNPVAANDLLYEALIKYKEENPEVIDKWLHGEWIELNPVDDS